MTKNPLKILYEGRHNILKPIYWILWVILTLFIVVTNMIPNLDPVINLSNIIIANQIEFTGMGLIVTIIVSLIGITYFSKSDYKAMYEYENILVSRSIAPFIFIIGIWTFNIILSLTASINTLPIQSDMLNIISVLYISMIILGLLGIVSLILTYFKNIYYTHQRNKKNINNNKDN